MRLCFTGKQINKIKNTKTSEKSLKLVFILCSIRSGSTLLTSILNSNSDIYAPHETHFTGVTYKQKTELTKRATKSLSIDKTQLKYALWNNYINQLADQNNGKIIVEKTPNNVLKWRDIESCWPNAKIIFLLRHPLSVAESWQRAKPDQEWPQIVEKINEYCSAVDAAKENIKLKNCSIKYENLTWQPEQVIKKICKFIDVPYEKQMLNYGQYNISERRFIRGLNDWSEKIKSGRIQPVKRMPKKKDTPDILRKYVDRWHY